MAGRLDDKVCIITCTGGRMGRPTSPTPCSDSPSLVAIGVTVSGWALLRHR